MTHREQKSHFYMASPLKPRSYMIHLVADLPTLAVLSEQLLCYHSSFLDLVLLGMGQY